MGLFEVFQGGGFLLISVLINYIDSTNNECSLCMNYFSLIRTLG